MSKSVKGITLMVAKDQLRKTVDVFNSSGRQDGLNLTNFVESAETNAEIV